jgi:uncharacterized protein with gpF-like domain
MSEQDWSKLTFKEALAFFRQKRFITSKAWDEILGAAHDDAFTIAGLANKAALSEFSEAIQKQLADGISFQAFQKDFDSLVAKYGWAHRGDRMWRSTVIFETNIRTAYAAGRWQQLQEPDAKRALPYIQYRHSGAEHFRPMHKSWDKLVLPADDKFWKTNWPPNGFGCKCTAFPISARTLKYLGKSGPDENPYDVIERNGGEITEQRLLRGTGEYVTVPRGVDPGWDYAPGASLTERLARAGKKF